MGSATNSKDGSYYHIFRCVFILFACVDAQDLKACGFDAIYQFGDSFSDTGNAKVEFPTLPYDQFPFGMTINNATGRASDGLLIIDFIAQAAGLPYVQPYENPKSNFSNGVDFAVAGQTAVTAETLIKWNIPPFVSNNSLTVQLGWFEKHLSTICSNAEACKEKLKSGLFMVGTIGFNDYNMAFKQNKAIEEIKNLMVPTVVETIIDVGRKVIGHGATRVVFPGIFQLGCSPGILTLYETDTSVHDAQGCLKDYNDMFAYHNDHLKTALEGLRKEFPNVQIVYADIYSALQWVFDNFANLGFKALKEACCGIGGKYNWDPDFQTKSCGRAGIPYCSNPEQHIFWDVAHLTHQTCKSVSDWLLKDLVPKLQCGTEANPNSGKKGEEL